MNKEDHIRLAELHDHQNYSVTSLEEEIRAERHCAELLKHFHQYLLEELHTDPLDAGALAAGADYFLREFIIGDRRENIFEISALRVRQFGSNWYVIRNLEPNLAELTDMVQGAAAFYSYCATQGLIDATTAEQISRETSQLEDFNRRIEEFHQISGDGFKDWDRQCPIG
ncbi:MAG: hypothetical protein C0619_11070 [Desulfuromonas sp.]|nr:MAG: hypothetical protein C0619_11070 [Desulfuromonas sp.]